MTDYFVSIFSIFFEQSPYIAIFILLVLGGVGLPFPEDATLMLSGFLISVEVIRPLYAFLAIYPGLLIADFILYSAGRKWGRKILTHRRLSKVLPPERFKKLEEMFRRQGIFFIFFGRHFLGFRVQIFLVSGIMEMPAWKFLAADALSAIITITIMVGAGYLGGNSLGIIMKDIKRVEHLAVLLLIAIFLAFLVYRYKKNRERM